MLKRTVLAGCFALLAAGGCTPSTSGPPPTEPPTGEPPDPPVQAGSCMDCPEPQLFCNAETNVCRCDANGKTFPRAECPATGAADPSPPPGCPPRSWFCNLSGDCRCAE
jgi:hypothetical protein